jgi:hypothetical protein
LNIKSVYNQVYPIQKPDWSREVTDESKNAFVLVLLTSSHGTNTESRVLVEIWRELARKFGDIKFCQIRGDLCIEGYPDKNTPTILIYRDGDIRRQIVTLRELNGPKTTSQGKRLPSCHELSVSLARNYDQIAPIPVSAANRCAILQMSKSFLWM